MFDSSKNQFLYKFTDLLIIYLYSYVLKLQDEINIKWDYTQYTIAMFKQNQLLKGSDKLKMHWCS